MIERVKPMLNPFVISALKAPICMILPILVIHR